MRDQKEKKTVTKSAKMTETQCMYLEEQATLHHMSFGNYLVSEAMRSHGCDLPQITVIAQNITNEVNRLKCEYELPENATKKLDGEVQKLWSKLK